MADNIYKTKVEDGQNLFDLAIQLYGDVGEVWRLMGDNAVVIPSLNTVVDAGTELKAQKEVDAPIDEAVMVWFRKNKIIVNTGFEGEISNYLLQENDYKILQEDDFGILIDKEIQ